jgi:uncharacterized protein (TIGR00369 family)
MTRRLTPAMPKLSKHPAAHAGRHLRQTISGLELFQRMSRGEVPPPPLVRLLGFRITLAEAGHVVFTADPREEFYNGVGVVHGGWAASLLDSALGCAINSLMPAGRTFTTLELKVNLTRPLRREVGEVRCEGRVLHLGSRIATAEAKILDAADKLYAHGTTTCILVEDRPAESPASRGSRR